MNGNQRSLVIGLCAQIGMIMEETVDLALTARDVADENLAERLHQIDGVVRQMQVLISAAITPNPQA